MATASVTTTSISFQPAFKRVAQQGRHDDTFAVIATLTGKTLESVLRQAESLGLPKIGPYYSHIDGDLIAKLLASEGLVATVWKESKQFKDLPDVAIAMVDYDADWEEGRVVLFHRIGSTDGKPAQLYVVDPYPHTNSQLHVRTDLTSLIPSWYIGVHQQKKSSVK